MLRLTALILAAAIAIPAHAQPGPEAECPPATSTPSPKPPRTTSATPPGAAIMSATERPPHLDQCLLEQLRPRDSR